MEAVAAHILTLAEGGPGIDNVVAMPPARAIGRVPRT
jgi:hypothetical protein